MIHNVANRWRLIACLVIAVSCGGGRGGSGGDAPTGGRGGELGLVSGGSSATGGPTDAGSGGSFATGGSTVVVSGGGVDAGGSTGASSGGSSASGGNAGGDAPGGTGGGGGSSETGGSAGWEAVPAILSRIVPPTFPDLDCDVVQYGGVGNGVADNTAAFAKAIADCASRGGGRVVTPAGKFLTGPIELTSNINLYVGPGATIQFSTDPNKYLPPVEVSWAGSLAQNYHPLIWAHDATNVAITGPGIIDGNASRTNWYAWLQLQKPDDTNLRQQNADGVPPSQRIYGRGHFLRPALIEFMRCNNVLFDGFTAKNSPFWTIHPVLSTNVTARNFQSLSDATVVNTDGFDPESCSDVLIQNATIAVGDDAIAIKAGRDRDGMTYYKPSENIVIQNATLLSRWGGITIGSEVSAGVRNVFVEDSKFAESGAGLHYGFFIKSATTRGGFIENIYARRLSVGTVDSFIYLTGHYVVGAVVGSLAFTLFKNIDVDTATVSRTTSHPFFIDGADKTKVAVGIHLSNVTVAASTAPALAPGSGHYQDFTTSNVLVNGSAFNPPTSAP
jgi:hypothetical protein